MLLQGQILEVPPHFEHYSCPDAESYLTGIDYFEHLCTEARQKLPAFSPYTFAQQASRIEGITSADIMVIQIHL